MDFRSLFAALGLMAAPAMAEEPAETATAIFAGGCFWCVEADFDKVPGVVETVSGFTGGTTEDPTYNEVTGGDTGHYEAVEITYDPSVVTYEELLEVFWHSVDPTDPGGQFCDRGSSYRTAVFARSDEQLEAAQASKQKVANELEDPIVTPIEEAQTFYPAEDYHQNYYKKNPLRYRYYRFACGRDNRVEELWGDEAHKGIKTS